MAGLFKTRRESREVAVNIVASSIVKDMHAFLRSAASSTDVMNDIEDADEVLLQYKSTNYVPYRLSRREISHLQEIVCEKMPLCSGSLRTRQGRERNLIASASFYGEVLYRYH